VFHEPHDFAGLGVASDTLLGEHTTAVDFHLEHAARRLNPFHVGVRIRLANFGRQTGGPRLIISDDAVFDGDSHA